MLTGNQLKQELIRVGLAEEPKEKKPRRKKQFKCKQCGSVMENPDWFVNGMYCPNCEDKVSYFLFTKNRED